MTADAKVIETLAMPFMQYGFAGFVFLLIFILSFFGYYVIKSLAGVIQHNTIVIASNTSLVQDVKDVTIQQNKKLDDIKDALIRHDSATSSISRQESR